MNERCKHVKQDGFNCGSYAFNLYKDDIDQGDLCDVHYWQSKAQSTKPVCPDCKAEVLYECVACSSNNYPSQRTWVGLTPEEILDMFDDQQVYGSKWLEFSRAVENKLKEKNNA